MTLEIVLKELRENFYTVRFYIILIMTISLFAVSGIIFMNIHKQKVSDYRNSISENETLLNAKSKNLCDLAQFEQGLVKKTNPLEFLSEANEKYLPNTFETDIFTLSFPQVEGRGNILLRDFKTIDWEFLVGIILSFLAFVLSYDAVCGEKEQKTLSLVFSNSVKAAKVFSGKFLGLLISLSIPFLIGVTVALLIMGFNREISVEYGRVGFFIAVSLIYLSLFLLIGMTVSSLFSQSITSAVTLLFIWILFAFIIPASGNLIAHGLYPIPTQAHIQEEIGRTQNNIYESKYSKTDAGRWDGDPFKPWVPLRSQWMEDIMHARNQIFDDYIYRMIRQVERTKNNTKISPVSVFRSLVEEIAGTGVNRFRNFYSQVNRYKIQLYRFVETKDSLDPESPHLIPLAYHMNQGISQKPVEFSSVPRFEEELPSVKDNLKPIIVDLAILALLSIVFFYLGYILFVRYDKR